MPTTNNFTVLHRFALEGTRSLAEASYEQGMSWDCGDQHRSLSVTRSRSMRECPNDSAHVGLTDHAHCWFLKGAGPLLWTKGFGDLS